MSAAFDRGFAAGLVAAAKIARMAAREAEREPARSKWVGATGALDALAEGLEEITASKPDAGRIAPEDKKA